MIHSKNVNNTKKTNESAQESNSDLILRDVEKKAIGLNLSRTAQLTKTI
jgi:hypothetical protein